MSNLQMSVPGVCEQRHRSHHCRSHCQHSHHHEPTFFVCFAGIASSMVFASSASIVATSVCHQHCLRQQPSVSERYCLLIQSCQRCQHCQHHHSASPAVPQQEPSVRYRRWLALAVVPTPATFKPNRLLLQVSPGVGITPHKLAHGCH